MYNLLECSDNYSVTSGSLWNYYRDEVNDASNENNTDNNRINTTMPLTSKSFKSDNDHTPEPPEVHANPNANPPSECIPQKSTFDTTFQINSSKLYASVITLFINNQIKFLENIKQRFKRTSSWKKCRSEIATTQKQQFGLYN